jgi:hypothetical protein
MQVDHHVQLSGVLCSRAIRHSVDDWGPDGGHDWPYWRREMDESVGQPCEPAPLSGTGPLRTLAGGGRAFADIHGPVSPWGRR